MEWLSAVFPNTIHLLGFLCVLQRIFLLSMSDCSVDLFLVVHQLCELTEVEFAMLQKVSCQFSRRKGEGRSDVTDLVKVGPAEHLPELFVGERVVAGGGEAVAQLVRRQAVLVANVKLLKGLSELLLPNEVFEEILNFE